MYCARRGAPKSIVRNFVFFVNRIHRQKEYCLLLKMLTSRYQSCICDVDGTSNVINVLEEIVRNQDIVL